MNNDNSSNTAAIVAIVAIVVILIGVAVWFMQQRAPAESPQQPGADIDVTVPDLNPSNSTTE